MINEHLVMNLEHISDRTSMMNSGEPIEYQGLFESWAWHAIPANECRHYIGPYVSLLVRQKKVPLEFAGFDHRRHKLYRKL